MNLYESLTQARTDAAIMYEEYAPYALFLIPPLLAAFTTIRGMMWIAGYASQPEPIFFVAGYILLLPWALDLIRGVPAKLLSATNNQP